MSWAERQPNGRYRARWRDALNVEKSRSGFVHKADAKNYAAEQELAARRGQASYSGRSLPWGAWCDEWLRLRQVERTTEESDNTRIDRWLRPQWESTPMARIEVADVQAWVNTLRRQMAPASVAKVYGLFRASMAAAVKYRRIPVSPCQSIDLPVIPPSDERFVSPAEFAAVCEYLRQPYRRAAVALYGLGLRFGEMAGLHQHRVDWAGMTVDVFEVWDGQQMKSYPKGRLKRRVPMPTWVADELAGSPSAASCGFAHVGGSRCRSGLVILGPMGKPLQARNMLRRHWKDAVDRAGVDDARQHDLRHGFASNLVQAGRSMAEIADVMGHSETTVTARYAHLAGSHMDGIRAALESAAPFRLPVPLEP